MRILFLSRGLNVGGAQRQLVALARGLRRDGHDVSVAVFYGGGVFEEELRSDGIAIRDLRKRGRWDTLPFMSRLVRLVRSERPDALHAYMGGANLFSAALKPFFGPVKVVWGIRSAMTDLRAYDWASTVGSWLERLVSPLADVIVANSEAARRSAISRGMDAARIVVVPNGIDCQAFRFDPEGRSRLRREWGVGERSALVGVVARLDPVKGHATFLRAAARVAAGRPDVHFVCVGDGAREYRGELERLGAQLGLGERLTWAGERKVTSAIYSAFDVAVLSSDPGESFPNVVGEAMACGRPCVVTRSGDAAEVVGNTGAVVPPRDPAALADGILRVLEGVIPSGTAVDAPPRARIEREYSVEKLVGRTQELLERLVQGAARGAGEQRSVTRRRAAGVDR